MLYKKNKSKELDEKLFKNPTAEYRGTPFWAWNCKLNKDILGRQIEYMKEMGLGGFHMHSRTGMANEYLGEEFMDLVKFCVKKAEKEEMLAWLYDEDRWPSGFAGGLVTKEKRHRVKIMTFNPEDKQDDAKTLEECLETGKPFFFASYDIVLNDRGELASYTRIGRDEEGGNKWYAFLEIGGDNPWFNNQAYVDTLDKESMKKFIDITYEAYKEAVGDKFGESVPAIFTDEPQVHRRHYMKKALAKERTVLPWTHHLIEGFKKEYGYDILDYLPELIWSLEGGKVSRVKYHYSDYTTELFSRCFSDQCGDWCEENNLMLTGHMMEEPTLLSQSYAIGETMRHYRSFQLPGIDMLCDATEYTTAKQAQSAAHQYGREGVLSELYGVTNWVFDFRGHKFQGDWQAALGVTVRVHHLSWVSMAGESKRDYPATINYQSPWYKEYSYVEDHFARLNTALTRGKPVVKVGVVHPVESYWLHLGPEDTTSEKRWALEHNFQNITKWLLLGQVDFDFIAESILPDLCKEAGSPLKVGEMEYDTIIVPGMETMRRTTYERLKAFKEKGGKIVFVGECPKYMDATATNEIEALYNDSIKVPFEREKILEVLGEDKIINIYKDNEISDKYLYNLRDDENCMWLFIARGVHVNDKEDTQAENLKIVIKGEYYPKVYDTINGEVKDAEFSYENGNTVVYAKLHSYDSLLLRLGKLEKVEIMDNVSYTLEEPNVYLLDIAEYALDDEEYNEAEEILRADNKLRERLGWQLRRSAFPQPWTVEEEEIVHKARLRFTIHSEITVKEPLLAIEDAERIEIVFNGEKVACKVVGWFTDEAIKTVRLPEIKKGTNILEVSIPFGKRTNVEWCYILGDFGVVVEGTKKTITERSDKVRYGTITDQGMPFYGANIVYHNEIELEEDSALRVRIPKYRGSLVKVLLDSKEAGKIVYAPYELVIPNVKKGKHVLGLVLYGNRHNSFGTLHNCNEKTWWFGPDAWRTTGDSWSYEYSLKDMGVLEKPIVEILK